MHIAERSQYEHLIATTGKIMFYKSPWREPPGKDMWP